MLYFSKVEVTVNQPLIPSVSLYENLSWVEAHSLVVEHLPGMFEALG